MSGLDEQIADLRARGYKVRFKHLRRYTVAEPTLLMTVGEARWAEANPLDFMLNNPGVHFGLEPRGGQTFCIILDAGRVVASGEARCWDGDVYQAAEGRRIAASRALGQFYRRRATESVH